MFTRLASDWTQQACIKASNSDADDNFGELLSLAADGSVLLVGARNEDSNASGVDAEQADNTAQNASAAYVFTW